MKRSVVRKICVLVCVMTLFSSFTVSAADKQVTMSDKEYVVTVDGANNLFMSNDKPVSGEVGSKVFLTYTVEKVSSNIAAQNGIIATTDNTADFPYVKEGKMCFDDKSVLYEEGYTYIFRFERTENGLEYECAKLKGKEAVTIKFAHATASSKEDDYTYFGVWTSASKEGKVSAVLNHVRCYDENGNDLGIHFNNESGYKNDELNNLLGFHPTINSSYSFKLEDAGQVAISNKYPCTGDVMYMEYEVKDVEKDDSIQHGVIATNSPTVKWPYQHGKGLALIDIYEKSQADKVLLREGGKYFVCMIRKEGSFVTYVQCTLKGKTETFTFTTKTGVYNEAFAHYCLWMYGPVTATFENVKCYDAKGNSLGIQLNRIDTPLSHKGEMEDYSKSQATYYCKENGALLELADKKNAVLSSNGEKKKGTYSIQADNDLYLILDEGKIEYEYNPLIIKDEEGNVYRRLREVKVTFVTGKENIEVLAKASNGYRVEEPENPVQEGRTFKGWYLGDGTAFDFQQVVAESTTLYAKWQDGDGNEYLAVNQEIEDTTNWPMVVSVIATAVLIVGFTIGGVVIVRRKRKA